MLVVKAFLLSRLCLLVLLVNRAVFEVLLGLVYQFFPLVYLLFCLLDALIGIPVTLLYPRYSILELCKRCNLSPLQEADCLGICF